ncbi:MAG: 50S ribosomal protein L6, partial [Candidatus Colwellbacteria bacterium]|nr:50S ribosomal protein L6 [Candidatus Colwellbacteria bacterium]
MSKIGKKPVVIGEGVTVNLGEDSIEVRGEGVALSLPILSGIKVQREENELIFI